MLTIAAHQADVLVHESTFAEEDAERAHQTGHCTALQAAHVARDAQARLLALTHISTRYPGGDLREEARSVFANTEAPRDFDTIEVPFPEKGPAELIRWSDRRRESRAPSGQSAEAESVSASADTAAEEDASTEPVASP